MSTEPLPLPPPSTVDLRPLSMLPPDWKGQKGVFYFVTPEYSLEEVGRLTDLYWADEWQEWVLKVDGSMEEYDPETEEWFFFALSLGSEG